MCSIYMVVAFPGTTGFLDGQVTWVKWSCRQLEIFIKTFMGQLFKCVAEDGVLPSSPFYYIQDCLFLVQQKKNRSWKTILPFFNCDVFVDNSYVPLYMYHLQKFYVVSIFFCCRKTFNFSLFLVILMSEYLKPSLLSWSIEEIFFIRVFCPLLSILLVSIY
jgi:hypothetical protein